MAGLAYVGATPNLNTGTDLVNRLALNNTLATGVSRAWVISEIANLSAPYATMVYSDNQMALYAQPSYATTQENTLILKSQLGVPTTTSPAVTGVATLDTGGKVPLAQMPNLGVGYVLGPYGTTATAGGGSTASTPVKIADFNIGTQSLNFHPWAFASVFIQATNNGRPCVELRISNGTPASYAASTLIAQGVARNAYNDYSSISVMPCPDTTGESPTQLYSPTYATWVSMWVYDLNGQTLNYTSNAVASASVFLIRTAQ